MSAWLRAAWPQLLLELVAAAWLLPLGWCASVWFKLQAPLWFWIVAVALILAARHLSRTAAIAASFALAAAAALWSLPSIDFAASVVTLLVALRLLVLERGHHWALRAEFARGLLVWLVIGVARAALQQPHEAALAPFAILFMAGGLFGLPLVHAREALGPHGHILAAARPGLRVGLLSLGVGGAAAVLLLIAGIVLRSGDHLFRVLLLTFYVLAPLITLIGEVVQAVIAFIKAHGRHAHLNLPSIGGTPSAQQAKANQQALAHNEHLLLLAFGIAIVLIAAFAVYLAVHQHREPEGTRNAPAEGQHPLYTLLGVRRRGRYDYGSGARGQVRAEVGRHLQRRERRAPLADHVTPRQLGHAERWPDEAIQAYEEARFRLRTSYDPTRLQSFMAAFRDFLGRRSNRPRR